MTKSPQSRNQCRQDFCRMLLQNFGQERYGPPRDRLLERRAARPPPQPPRVLKWHDHLEQQVVITTCRRWTRITPPPHLGPADLADYVEAATIAVQANPARTIGSRPSNPGGALFADLAAAQLDG